MFNSSYAACSIRHLATGLLITAAAALCLFPVSAGASFGGGSIQLGFGFVFVAASAIALPGALLCLVFELVGARRRPPLWVGILAGGLAVYCAARAIGFGPRGNASFFIVPVPPLMTLVLVTFVRPPRLRVAAGWVVAALGIGLFLRQEGYFGNPLESGELLGATLGGAFMSLLLWHLAFLLRRRSQRDAVAPPAPAAERPNPLSPAVDWWRRSNPGWLALSAGSSAQQGFVWWLGGAAAWYAGIGLLTALGFEALCWAMLQIEWQLADLLGLRTPVAGAKALRDWAVHGLAWSVVAGCGTWGAAATAGRFDAGRLSPLRFAAVAMAIAMVLAVAIAAGPARNQIGKAAGAKKQWSPDWGASRSLRNHFRDDVTGPGLRCANPGTIASSAGSTPGQRNGLTAHEFLYHRPGIDRYAGARRLDCDDANGFAWPGTLDMLAHKYS